MRRIVSSGVWPLFLKNVGFLVVNRYRQGILLTVYVLRREHTQNAVKEVLIVSVLPVPLPHHTPV
jgi:hypothetical protein